ncbi:MAG: chemotaxis protein CheW [Anaerolineae bacterium]|nr:chemotaxis protein CheW [Anaerolineae bacterium]
MSERGQHTRVQLIVFHVEQIEFAVPIDQVWRVELLSDHTITRVPRALPFLIGVINVRGQVIPLFDLASRLGFPSSGLPAKARVIIVEMDDQRVGLIVDGVHDIRWFPTAKIEPPPPTIAQINGVFVNGVGKEDDRLLVILDLCEVLTPGERQQLQEMHTEAGATSS